MDDENPHDVNIESKRNGAQDIYDDAFVVAYLQAKEVPIGLTCKEKDHVVHKVKRFKWEGNSFLRMWANGQVKVMLCLEQCEILMRHVHEELGHFGV